jgi:hypothetical protein
MYLIDSEIERPDHHGSSTMIKKRKTDEQATLPAKKKKINMPEKVTVIDDDVETEMTHSEPNIHEGKKCKLTSYNNMYI